MTTEALRLELIEWLTQVNNHSVLEVFKSIKDSELEDTTWWQTISDVEKKGVERGLRDSENGKLIDHAQVKEKHGL